MPELIHVGFGNILAVDRAVAIIAAGSSPIKRVVQEATSRGLLIDITRGRKTKTILIMDSGHVVLTALSPETIARRALASRQGAFLGRVKAK